MPSVEEKEVAMNNECKTISVPEAGRILGIGINAAYAAAKDGTIPTLKIGRLKRVPVVALNRILEQAGQDHSQ
jgi:hypothetical protein